MATPGPMVPPPLHKTFRKDTKHVHSAGKPPQMEQNTLHNTP